jgi:putative tricarboxylic transport membrane protein
MIRGFFHGARNLRRGSLVALSAALLIGLTPIGQAQAKWPDKPVRIVLPFGAGGVSDFTLRIVADKLSTKFGQRFYVENRPGPGGINEALTVLNSPPDGYTVGLVAILNALSVASFKKLPYNPVTQFETISTIGKFDMDFVVKADSPYKTLGDFIKAAKEQPGKLNIGTVAIGSAQNFGAQLFKSLAKINVVIVPFHRSPDAVVGLLRNDVQLLVDFPPAVKGQIDSGKLRALATSGAKRALSTPNVPTVEEAGVKGYEMSSWNGLFAPKGTPKEIIDTMNKAIHEVLAMPDVQAKFATVGFEPEPSTPDAVMTRLKSEIKKWEKVREEAGIPKS